MKIIKHQRNYWFLLPALLLFGFSLKGQGMLQTDFVRNDAGISRSRLDSIKNLVSVAWNQYVSRSGLLNPATREVDNESIDALKQLFTFNAKVYNDLVESPAMLHHADYVSQVFRRLPKEGVRCWFEEATLTRISYDAAGFYRVEVSARKVLLNGISVQMQSGQTNARRCYDLKFRFEVPAEKFGVALINQIEGTPCVPERSQGGKLSLTGVAQLSFPSLNFKLSDERIPDAAASLDSRPAFAGGLYLRGLTGSSNRWDLGIGLLFTQLEIEANLTALTVNDPRTDQLTLNLASYQELTRISYLELPVGLHYRLSETEKWRWSADVFALTTIRSKQKEGQRTYDMTFPNPATDTVLVAPADFWTFFSARFGLSGCYTLTSNLGLELGASYTVGISPLFGHQPRGDFFLDRPANIQSPGMKFLETYLESLHANAFNLRIGVVYHFN